MKLLKVLNLFFLHLIFAEISLKLSENACKIVTLEFEIKSWMKTVAILEFDHNFNPEVLNNFLQCLPMEISVITIDGKTFNLNQPRIHNVDFTVMFIDKQTANSNYLVRKI